MLILCSFVVRAQIPAEELGRMDSVRARFSADTIPPVSTSQPDYKRADSGLQAEAEYGSNDSMFYDNISGEWHLWGDAYVRYQGMSVEADYIVFNMDSSIATAVPWPDSSGTLSGYPVFSQGQRRFEAEKMRYNFGTSKGMIYDVVTKEGDLVIHGSKTKFVGASEEEEDDQIYNQGAIITTCTHPVPHYGIRSNKIKTIPDRLAVIGPSNVELQGVPTPLWLPFGFFPITTQKKAGLIFPDSYEFSDTWGFGLRGVGYYVPINDYMDITALGDIYFNGSWGLRVRSNYRKRYKFNGSWEIGYSKRINPISGRIAPRIDNSFSVRLNHSQAAQAHPYSNMSGSINIQSNGYQDLNFNDANSVLTNTFNSNFSWRRTFPGKPYSLTVGLTHSQNTNTGLVTINAPDVQFRLNRIYPFKRKQKIGADKWYEKIGFQYSGDSKTMFTATDTSIISEATWRNAQTGVRHQANADFNFSLFKYLHFTPQISYQENWYLKTKEKLFFFDPDSAIVRDTIISETGEVIISSDTTNFGEIVDTLNRGFTSYRQYNASINLNTQLFFTVQTRKGFFRGFRHILKPSFSYSFEPSNTEYLRTVRNDIRDPESMQEYSIFEGTLFPARVNRQTQSLFTYSFNNIFEAKFWSKKDSTAKKMKLFDNFVISGNHNFALPDTVPRWSPISMRGTARFFKQATTLSFTAIYDLYGLDEKGRRSDEFYWETDRKLLRFSQLQLGVATTLTVKKVKEIFGGDQKKEEESSRERGGRRDVRQEKQKFFDLFDGFSLNHNFRMTRIGRDGPDETTVNTHTVNLRGTVNLTEKWRISIGNIGFDFRSGRITYPDITFLRDLHCWELRFSWQPERGTYLMHIGVKPGTLDFLKIPSQRNNQNIDRFGGF